MFYKSQEVQMFRRKEVQHPTKLNVIPLNTSNEAVLKNPNIKKMMATLIVLYYHIFRYNNIALCSTWSSCSCLLFTFI